MPKSIMSRKAIVSNATHDLVKMLELYGVTCVVIQEMAAFLQGSKAVPKDVKIVITPLEGGSLSTGNLEKYLVEQHPAKFRVRHRKNKTDVLSYYDPTIPPPKKNYCDFELVIVKDPSPPEYRSELTRRIDGLPVLSLFSIVMDLLQDLLSQYDSTTNKADFARQPPKKLNKKLRLLLSAWSPSIPAPADKSFRLEASECFMRASSIFPEFSTALSSLIRSCRNTKPTVGSIRLAHPNGTPVVDVTHLLHNTLNIEVSTPEPTVHSTSPPKLKTTAQLRTEIIYLVAKKITDILRQVGVDSALFGSLACNLYGNERAPNDVDIIAFPPAGRFMTAEWLKQAIASRDPVNLSLEAAKNPQATFRVLYFLVDDGLASSGTFHRDKCKIDILLPGLLHLPSLPTHAIKWKAGLPVIPFSVLLLQKLQGWDDHRHMSEPYKYEKHITDAADVHNLLKLEHVVALRFSKPWADRDFFSQDFYNLSVRRVREFAAIYPASANDWARLGFNV